MSADSTIKFTNERYERFITSFVTYIMEHQGFDVRVPNLPAKLVALDQLSNDDVYAIRKKVWERTQELLQIMGLEIHASVFNLTIRVEESSNDH